jgi:hypothetical protein
LKREVSGGKDVAGKEVAAEASPAYTPLTQQDLLPLSPDLGRVVAAWPELPLHIRTSILALVEAARRR